MPVFKVFSLFQLTVEDKQKAEEKDRINEVMGIFGLKAVRQNLVGKQSGGQKKRISIATEFISSPYLFILDEPDSGLDGVLARDLIILAKDAERTGRLVFYGSIPEAREFFGTEKLEDMVRMINRKEEGGEGRADELIEKYGGISHE